MSKKQQILDVAQSRVRTGGYNHFSFRDIADEVGIKSASVHYHFPTKADLGAELVRRYTDVFLGQLRSHETLAQQGLDPLKYYVGKFRMALEKDGQMCLCGLLGAESSALPDSVKTEIQAFFECNIDWLSEAYRRNAVADSRQKAMETLALLEGAMMIANTMGDIQWFDNAVKGIGSNLV